MVTAALVVFFRPRDVMLAHANALPIVLSRGPRLIFGNSDYAADKWAAAAAVLASREAFIRLGAHPLVARVDRAREPTGDRAATATVKAGKATGDVPVNG